MSNSLVVELELTGFCVFDTGGGLVDLSSISSERQLCIEIVSSVFRLGGKGGASPKLLPSSESESGGENIPESRKDWLRPVGEKRLKTDILLAVPRKGTYQVSLL